MTAVAVVLLAGAIVSVASGNWSAAAFALTAMIAELQLARARARIALMGELAEKARRALR